MIPVRDAQKIVLNHPRGTKHFSEISDKTRTHTAPN